MAVNKIDAIIDGLTIFKTYVADPEIKLSGYMMRLPQFDEIGIKLSEAHTEELNEMGWNLSQIKNADGPLPGFEGYIYGGDI